MCPTCPPSAASASSENNNTDNNDHLVLSSDSSHPANLIPALCAKFWTLGWVTGTGGGASIRDNDLVYLAPSGVQKELMKPEDIYVLSLAAQATSPNPKQRVYLRSPANYKPSQCTPLFLAAFTKRNAGCCIHTHSHWAVLVTLLLERERSSKEGDEEKGKVFEINNIEQIKGFGRGFGKSGNLGYHDTLRIPVIENTAHEEDLTEFLEEAMDKYPDTYAVLVRRHGVYVWGENVHKAKTMCERYVCFVFFLVVVVVVRIDGSGGAVELERGLTFTCVQLGLPLPTRRRDEAARSSLDYRHRAYHSYQEVNDNNNNNDNIVIPDTKHQQKHSIKTIHIHVQFSSVHTCVHEVIQTRWSLLPYRSSLYFLQLFSFQKVSNTDTDPTAAAQNTIKSVIQAIQATNHTHDNTHTLIPSYPSHHIIHPTPKASSHPPQLFITLQPPRASPPTPTRNLPMTQQPPYPRNQHYSCSQQSTY